MTDKPSGKELPLHQTFQDLPRKCGVLSLSGNPTDALLWSHYADGHRGVSIGLDRDYFSDLLDDWRRHNLLGGQDVTYAEAPIEAFRDYWIGKVEAVQAIRQAHGKEKQEAIAEFEEAYKREMLVAVLTLKSTAWAYEQEYRAVREQPGPMQFEPRVLTEIIFGLRTLDQDQALIRTLLAGKEWSHVRYRHPVCDEGMFELTLVDC